MIPIKNTKEIEKMRQSCRTASDILDRVTELIRPGITTAFCVKAASAADSRAVLHMRAVKLRRNAR